MVTSYSRRRSVEARSCGTSTSKGRNRSRVVGDSTLLRMSEVKIIVAWFFRVHSAGTGRSSRRRPKMVCGCGGWRTLKPPPAVLKGHDGTVFSLSFDRDGKSIASASSDATVRIWSIEPALRADIKKASLLEDATPSAEASNILAQEGGRELVWDTSTSPPELRVRGWLRPVSLGQPRGFAKPAAAAFAPGSNFVLIAPSEHGRPLLYNLEFPEAPVAVLGETDAKWQSVAFAPDASRPVGITAKGERHSWTYFPERAKLVEFARQHLPQEGSEPAKLSEEDLSRLGLTAP